MFRHVDLSGVRDVLDAGAGWGRFDVPLLEVATGPLRLIATDVSAGIVSTCRDTVTSAGHGAEFAVADVRMLPFGLHAFDLVMANHMLYELDDVKPALRDLARVLRPDGCLLATTYSDRGRIPLIELHHAALAVLGIDSPGERESPFSLENGRELLERQFGHVETHVVHEHSDTFDANSLVKLYLKTGRYHRAATDQEVAETTRARIAEVFRELAASEIAANVRIRTTTHWTAFVARQPGSGT